MKTGNRARRDPAEGREASRGENRWPDTREGALDPTNLSTNRQRIANLARTKRGTALYSLHHVIDMDWMREAYRLTRKDGAAGIDGVTAAAYEVQLEANLRDLLDRIKSGRYQAPPVRRAYIPKADGSQRPLGIPTFEDKVAQRAIAMVLEAIYEQDFLPCSYGFRPARSAHQALHALRSAIWSQRLYWVLDVDIQKYLVPRCLVWVAPHAQVAPVLSTKQPIERSPSVPGAASAGLYGAHPLAWLRADQAARRRCATPSCFRRPWGWGRRGRCPGAASMQRRGDWTSRSRLPRAHGSPAPRAARRDARPMTPSR